MRVLHVGDLGLKRYGQLPNTFERKMFYGLLRNNYSAYEFSNKDVAKFEAPLHISRLGVRTANRRLLETVENFQPELVIFSNTNSIPNRTIEAVRRLRPELRVACYTCDPLFSEENRRHQVERLKVCDCLFVTMGGPLLQSLAAEGNTPVYYLPNPSDPSVEYLDNFDRDDLETDLLFCGTGSDKAPRTRFVSRLAGMLPGLNFRIHGILGMPKITGYEYFQALSKTRMALNINKQEQPLYSSDRIAQLMANGILCFLHTDSELQVFFGDAQGEARALFFSDIDDLAHKVRSLAADDARRRVIARAGAEYYRAHFNSALVARFVVETAMELPLSPEYVWPVERFG